ncbi:hypothetical protein GGX14DRAFT_479563 [Mycena pura]|uniref:Mid2 domain-containing protein n=1 Tax=Mycena pura TaxID=153505 RepID=A0AAD6UV94_9AGAR|nr:hypothetical protein GGX14DRAFT_479563 [Mycena pura]
MITVLYFLLASLFVCPSRAVTLSPPSTIKNGTSVEVPWTRNKFDPVAFDLAQYNSASEESGTVSVPVSTPGQVTFQAFAHRRLRPPRLPRPPLERPRRIRPLCQRQLNLLIRGGWHHNFNTSRGALSNTRSTGSSTPTAHVYVSAPPQPTNTSTNPTTGGPNGAVSVPQRGMSRAAMIALAILLPLLILVLGVMVYCYCMRRSKRRRMALFTNNWLRVRRRASTSSDDYGPRERGPGDPEEAARSGVDEKNGSAHPPRPTRTMRFQEMVAYLAEKNAARYEAAT